MIYIFLIVKYFKISFLNLKLCFVFKSDKLIFTQQIAYTIRNIYKLPSNLYNKQFEFQKINTFPHSFVPNLFLLLKFINKSAKVSGYLRVAM